MDAQKPDQGRPTITLNVRDADIRDFLRLIHETTGLNIVIAPNVQGRVAAMMENVLWEQALKAVLDVNGLIGERDGGVLRIKTLEDARHERESQRVLAEAALWAAPLMTCTYHLSNASSGDVVNLLRPLLSPRGRIAADVRTNMVVVTDMATVLESFGLSPAAPSRSMCFQLEKPAEKK